MFGSNFKTCDSFVAYFISFQKRGLILNVTHVGQSLCTSKTNSTQPAKIDLNKKPLPKYWSVQTMIFGP